MDKIKVGEVFHTTEGCQCEVISYISASQVVVKFLDEHGAVRTVRAGNLRAGSIKNPYHPSVHGVGYFGEGGSVQVGGKRLKEYSVWKGVMERCYCPKLKEKYPTYLECRAATEWHNYRTFALWATQQIGFYEDGWTLDKDILFPGNKLYAPETCVFIPPEVNLLFIDPQKRVRDGMPIGVTYLERRKKYLAGCSLGNARRKTIGYFNTPEEAWMAYKLVKEDRVKEVAEKWKGLVDERVYEALISYTVPFS